MKLRVTLDLELTVAEAAPDDLENSVRNNLSGIFDHAVHEGRITQGTSAVLRSHQWTARQIADVRQFVADAEANGLEPEDLDELVHDAASQLASAINNGGLDEQIGFLVEQSGTYPADLQALLGSDLGGKLSVPKTKN